MNLYSCSLLYPSCIHLLRWSLKCSVKQTWAGSAFSTNESLKCNNHKPSIFVCEVALMALTNERMPLNIVMSDLESKSKVHEEVVLMLFGPKL